MRLSPIARYFSKVTPIRFLVRIDLKKCADGKYRIYRSVYISKSFPQTCHLASDDVKPIFRQHDSFPNDLTMSGYASILPGLATVNDVVKNTLGFMMAKLGRFLLSRGWLGP